MPRNKEVTAVVFRGSDCLLNVWLLLLLTCVLGCTSSRHTVPATTPSIASHSPALLLPDPKPIALATHQQSLPSPTLTATAAQPSELIAPPVIAVESLDDLESLAIGNNPALRRLQHEAAAEWAKTGYVSKLPDPTLGTMFFIPPMRFEPDRQIAEVQVMQMIPWLSRLDAESQRAHLEALAAENEYHAERLRVIGDLRAAWFKLYVLAKQIETTQADQTQLESLIKTANARVAAGDAQPGDVLMATLELSSLQEQLISYRQQVASTHAELNRIVGRNSGVPIVSPQAIDAELPQWDHDLLRSVAMSAQPELSAARLQTAATRWGIEVARLKRRPDVTVSGGWIPMDAPGAVMPGDGADSWTLGVSMNLPVFHRKYDAMVSEASREHMAAHASEEEVMLRLDATLRDLWEQALAAQRTVELYERTILPQARQTFEADQKSLVNNTVTFDRVIRDYRTLLNLEPGYHRALGQLATTLARIRQTVGVDLLPTPELPQPDR
jgi:cobalt-zinc-cadmium efflux system outer membrane protein